MSNNTNKISALYSWPVIILLTVCFWPLGVFLIFKRTTMDKKATLASGKILKGVGIASCCLGTLGFLVSITDGFDGSDVIAIIFFVGAGAALIYAGNKTLKEANSVKQYLNIIVNGGERQLDAIATATGKQYDVVKKDVQKMINKGFLKNAYINESTREVVLSKASAASTEASAPSASGATAATQTRVIACPCCGANNTVTGDIGECEYCGSPLK